MDNYKHYANTIPSEKFLTQFMRQYTITSNAVQAVNEEGRMLAFLGLASP